jgi:hypothetical protein
MLSKPLHGMGCLDYARDGGVKVKLPMSGRLELVGSSHALLAGSPVPITRILHAEPTIFMRFYLRPPATSVCFDALFTRNSYIQMVFGKLTSPK